MPGKSDLLKGRCMKEKKQTTMIPHSINKKGKSPMFLGVCATPGCGCKMARIFSAKLLPEAEKLLADSTTKNGRGEGCDGGSDGGDMAEFTEPTFVATGGRRRHSAKSGGKRRKSKRSSGSRSSRKSKSSRSSRKSRGSRKSRRSGSKRR